MKKSLTILTVALGCGAANAAPERPMLLCGGSSPSWALEMEANEALFTTPDVQVEYSVADERRAEGRDWPRALTLLAPQDTAIAILDARTCDPEHDWTLRLLTQKNGEAVMYAGCCRSAEAE